MANHNAARPDMARILGFMFIGFLLVFLGLLPVATLPKQIASPDWLLLFCLGWVARRPNDAPWFAIAWLFFLRDIFSGNPPGLETLIWLVLTEFLRNWQGSSQETGFLTEWFEISLLIAIAFIAIRIGFIALAIAPPPLMLHASQALLSIIVYPVVVIALRLLLGVRPLSSAEMDDRF